MPKGQFFTFEGGEASGKSTLIKMTHEALLSKGHDVLLTREPGGSSYGEKIRSLIFGGDYTPSALCELLLVFAARRDHIEQVIKPALDSGKIILCDRYIDSSYVYQGILGGVDKTIIDRLCQDFVEPFFPSKVFWLTTDTDIALERLVKRGIENRNDKIDKLHIQKLSDAYHTHFDDKNSVIKIENNHNLEVALAKILNEINP